MFSLGLQFHAELTGFELAFRDRQAASDERERREEEGGLMPMPLGWHIDAEYAGNYLGLGGRRIAYE